MKFLSRNNLFNIILISMIATLFSLIMSFSYSRYIPQAYKADIPGQKESSSILTAEQLANAKKDIEKRIQFLKDNEKNLNDKQSIQNIKYHAIYVSWLPWIIIPFLFTLKHWSWGILLLLVPATLIPTGLFLPLEILIFSTCIYFGIIFKNLFIKLKKSDGGKINLPYPPD